LIGPGSEWFWSAAQFIIITISLAAIYLQLRAQGASNFLQRVETLQGEWESPAMSHARLTLPLQLRHAGPRDQGWVKAKPIADYFANIWSLYDRREIKVDEIGANWGRQMEIYSVLLQPLIYARREMEGVPNLYDWLERSPEILRKWEISRGIPPLDVSKESQRAFLDHTIRLLTERLRQRRDLQSGVIPGPPAAPASMTNEVDR
jgi:hypothetical protein